MRVSSLVPAGEAGRHLGSVQERLRPGFSDEATSWRSGETIGDLSSSPLIEVIVSDWSEDSAVPRWD